VFLLVNFIFGFDFDFGFLKVLYFCDVFVFFVFFLFFLYYWYLFFSG